MNSKLVLLSSMASCIVFAFYPAASKQAQRRHDLTIVYTNDVFGEIEPCG